MVREEDNLENMNTVRVSELTKRVEDGHSHKYTILSD